MVVKSKFIDRITIDPNVNGGKPSIRNMRFSVTQMLELLASGMTVEEILKDYPYIEKEDIHACLNFAAGMANTKTVVPL